MADPRGRDVTLALEDGSSTGTFDIIGRLRIPALLVDSRRVRLDEARSRHAARGRAVRQGIREISLSGEVDLGDAAFEIMLQCLFASGDVGSWRIILCGFGTIEAACRIVGFNRCGGKAAELALVSVGTIDFAAAADSLEEFEEATSV